MRSDPVPGEAEGVGLVMGAGLAPIWFLRVPPLWTQASCNYLSGVESSESPSLRPTSGLQLPVDQPCFPSRSDWVQHPCFFPSEVCAQWCIGTRKPSLTKGLFTLTVGAKQRKGHRGCFKILSHITASHPLRVACAGLTSSDHPQPQQLSSSAGRRLGELCPVPSMAGVFCRLQQ